MKKIYILLLLPLFLLSCGENEEVIDEKKDYSIEVKKIKDFDNTHIIEKTWKIASSQDISLTSKVNGEIGWVYVKAGDRVERGQILIGVIDSIANYSGNLEAASIGIQSAKINYENQKNNLDKAVMDTELNLKRTKKNFEISKQQIDQDKKKAKIDFENSDLNNIGSNSSLQLEKLDESISKAELDYNTMLLQNQQQVNTFISNAKNEYTSIKLLYADVIEFSDQILGVTKKNRDKNDSYQSFLGATDKNSLSDSKTLFHELEAYNKKLSEISTGDINESNIIEFLDQFQDGHVLLNDFLGTFESMLVASIDSVNFPRATFMTQTNGYQSQVQGGRTWFLATKNAITSFINTYKFNEASSQKQIELLYKDRDITTNSLNDGDVLGEIGYKKTILALEDQLSALETGFENAQITYENAVKSRTVTLKSLENQIRNARNGYSSALKEFNKLKIESPINGVVWNVLAQQWQEISQWTPLLSISNTSKGEIEVFLTKDELKYITEGQEVEVEIDDQEVKGNIYSISKIANSNLNYWSKISINESVSIVWSIVKVKIPVVLDRLILPVRIIETLWESKAQIKTLSGGLVVNSVIELGDIWGNNIEITSRLDPELDIIVSDIENFDDSKFILKLKQQQGETK